MSDLTEVLLAIGPIGRSRNMQTIAIVNEKGGTAKTTTTVSLAAALGEVG